MTTYKKNQIVTLGDSAFIGLDNPHGTPGVDPSWALLARGVPAPTTTGWVLTIVDGKWVAAAPTGGTGGGGDDGGDSGSGGTPTVLHQVTADDTAIGGWTRNADAQWGDLSTDGEVLTLTSSYAGQFVRYVYAAERLRHPIALTPTELRFDLFVPSADSEGMSAGIVLSNDGDAGHFNFRVDVNADGSFGVRFEQDGQANIFSTDGAGPFTLDAWHTVRFIRHGGAAVAFIDDVFVAGCDGGPTEVADGVTLLMYGGSSGHSQASFRNITATTYLFGGGSGGTTDPGTGGGGTVSPASTTQAGIVRLATQAESINFDGDASESIAITAKTFSAIFRNLVAIFGLGLAGDYAGPWEDRSPGGYGGNQAVSHNGILWAAATGGDANATDEPGTSAQWVQIALYDGSSLPTYSAATDEIAGLVRLATDEEAIAGTDTSTAMTPAEVKAAVAAGAYSLLAGWKGTYDPATTYSPGMLVRYNGALVLSLDVSTGAVPPVALPDTADWAVIVAKPPAGGTGGGNGPLVVGPTNSLTMPGLWLQTDNDGNFIQWWYDDHNGVGGSNTNGAVSFGPTNGLQQAGLWIQTDENLVPQMMLYDDGTH